MQTVLADNSLTEDEKTYAIRWLTKNYDRNKVVFNFKQYSHILLSSWNYIILSCNC